LPPAKKKRILISNSEGARIVGLKRALTLRCPPIPMEGLL
jgi:hypothetical protein